MLDGEPLGVNCFSKQSIEALIKPFGFVDIQWIGESKGFSNMLAKR